MISVEKSLTCTFFYKKLVLKVSWLCNIFSIYCMFVFLEAFDSKLMVFLSYNVFAFICWILPKVFNPGKGIFQNRAAMKMANMDTVFNFMFTDPRDEQNKSLGKYFTEKKGEGLLYAGSSKTVSKMDWIILS